MFLSLVSIGSFQGIENPNLLNLSLSELKANQTKAVPPLHCLMNDKSLCSSSPSVGQKLLSDRDLCDIELEVNDWVLNETKIFCAHKNILSVRSDVLKDMIKELMTEPANGTESKKPRLTLDALNPDAFHHVLQYLYTDKIDPKFDIKKNVMGLYAAARYLSLTDLEQSIEQYLSTSATISDLSNYILWTDKYSRFDMKRKLAESVQQKLDLDSNEWKHFRDAMCAVQDGKLRSSHRSFHLWKELANN